MRSDLAGRLRLASERIRRPAGHVDLASRTLSVELDNLESTFEHLDRTALRRAIDALAARRARVVVLPGGASVGVARQLCDELALLRRDVSIATGSPVATAARVADVGVGDVVVAVDLRRYDQAVIDVVALAADAGATVVAITDSMLSPLAAHADATLVVAAEGVGPFDSHLGVLAVANALIAGVSRRLRGSATDRIDRVEHAWRSTGAVVDG